MAPKFEMSTRNSKVEEKSVDKTMKVAVTTAAVIVTLEIALIVNNSNYNNNNSGA